MEEERTIIWSVDFNISLHIKGRYREIHFSELTKEEQEKILDDIKNEYHSGSF